MPVVDAAPRQSALFTPRASYKPFTYPWAYEAWLRQQQMHWLPQEVNLTADVEDWRARLTEPERNLLTQIFRFFTQSDTDVAGAYVRQYLPLFRPPEVVMMLTAFANSESIHQAAYSHLLDTIGMPETEYGAFLHYLEMREKHEYYETFDASTPRGLALTMAAFGAFTEGLQLFASFAILLNFPRFGKMKGMGQIIAWSSRDEKHHVENMIRLWHALLAESPGLLDDSMRTEIRDICDRMVQLEDAFINRAFELGGVQGLDAEEVKLYIRWLANLRLAQLGLRDHYPILSDPLPWVEEYLQLPEHANFFETRATEYTRAATAGNWNEVWS